MGFTYLVTVIIQKGSVEMFTWMIFWSRSVRLQIGKWLRDLNITESQPLLPQQIKRKFVSCVLVKFEDNKTAFVDFKFYCPHICCESCFSLDHSIRECTHWKIHRSAIPLANLPLPPIRTRGATARVSVQTQPRQEPHVHQHQ